MEEPGLFAAPRTKCLRLDQSVHHARSQLSRQQRKRFSGDHAMDSDHLIRLCGREVDRPGHICAFFDSADDAYDTLIPYFRDGIEADELVLNIVDDDRLAEHLDRLNLAGVLTDGKGVTVRGAAETYLETGRFEMERMVDFVHDALANARSQGKRVRTCGEMTWLRDDAPGSDRAIEYEARMNLLVPKFDCTFMCLYEMNQLTGRMIADLMATHPYVIMNGELRENKFYIPPERYLAELLGTQNGGRSEGQLG